MDFMESGLRKVGPCPACVAQYPRWLIGSCPSQSGSLTDPERADTEPSQPITKHISPHPAIPSDQEVCEGEESDTEEGTAERKRDTQLEELGLQIALAQSRIDTMMAIASAPQKDPIVAV